ncbi:MAG: hypothetical protein CVV27_03255 [Candidatus Melainabacteria bacterium HGW-Melainabacteria-1]|nr:MAG: hypothetical protein CVV27_03255 [Candidatus Melainabacteria bacterium HGW-Melainabacteria-1]
MAVPIGGFRPADGVLFYTQNHNRNYENLLLDVRSRLLETQDTRTRQTYRVVPRNYGNIDEEMLAERNSVVNTPNSNAAYTNHPGPLGPGQYSHAQGTPFFLEQIFANNERYVGLVASNVGTAMTIGTNRSDIPTDLYVGQIIEVNGEARTITAIGATPTATQGYSITLNAAFSTNAPIGSMTLIKGRDDVNPHLTEAYRPTDKYGSYIIDENRYQVDRNHGLIRYRPSIGSFSPANAIWHPENTIGVAYHFGKMVQVQTVPPPAGPGAALPGGDLDDGVQDNEVLGQPIDPLLTTQNPAATVADAANLTNFILPAPDGQYSNIRVSAPAGVSFEVELNGAKLAIVSAGGSVLIPFYDPDHTNDHLKANQNIDPDVYIQRFIKEGANHLVVKATRTASAAGATGIRVEGVFNGVDMSTGAVAATGKPHPAVSVHTLDWSASRHSVLGIVGKVDFDLGDRIALEDINDEVQKAQGVLESLTTIIAGTDINAFQSLLNVLK